MECAYAEQTPIEVTQQQMVTMRQGELPLMTFYNEIERRLTLIISKTLLSYDTNTAAILNKRSRQNALNAFVTGLKKSVRHVVLSAAPKICHHHWLWLNGQSLAMNKKEDKSYNS